MSSLSRASRPAVYHSISSLLAVSAAERWAPNDLSTVVMEDLCMTDTVGDGVHITSEFPSQALSEAELAEQARLDAEARAQREQERALQESYTSGYDEGRLDGEIAEGVRLRNAVTVAESALNEIREHEAAWQSSVQENIVALSIAVARHIIGRELHSDAETVAELVRRALAEFPIDQPMRIRVNPHDLSLLSAYTTPGGSHLSIAPNRDVRWHADPRLQPGGCIVEGRERIIDGRIDTALERLYRRMTYTDA